MKPKLSPLTSRHRMRPPRLLKHSSRFLYGIALKPQAGLESFEMLQDRRITLTAEPDDACGYSGLLAATTTTLGVR